LRRITIGLFAKQGGCLTENQFTRIYNLAVKLGAGPDLARDDRGKDHYKDYDGCPINHGHLFNLGHNGHLPVVD
jgi:hypothetical protein